MAWKWKNFLRNTLRKIEALSKQTKDKPRAMICSDALDLLSENEKEIMILRSQVQTIKNAREKEWQR